jgi:hypothetical protein
MIFVPIIVVVIFAIAFAPTGGRRSYRRRKTKGFIGCLMSEKPAGKMCGPGGRRKR